jgi:hypothetical protein
MSTHTATPTPPAPLWCKRSGRFVDTAVGTMHTLCCSRNRRGRQFARIHPDASPWTAAQGRTRACYEAARLESTPLYGRRRVAPGDTQTSSSFVCSHTYFVTGCEGGAACVASVRASGDGVRLRAWRMRRWGLCPGTHEKQTFSILFHVDTFYLGISSPRSEVGRQPRVPRQQGRLSAEHALP